MTSNDNREPKPAARKVNPMVQAAADQVRRSKKKRPTKARELPRWTCRDQLSLFDPSEVTE
ncbi:hypothetical protein [Nocardia sp. BMG111209]|uniref:hypothetical protein n=1 Tax=Nocardia sp. BMG111209 TaxID=1160137 RepID=UPI00037AA153|nr:hypothetical protein [Nocardia sp. BMG111209]